MSRLVDEFTRIRPECLTIAERLLPRVEAAVAPELKMHSWRTRVKGLEGLKQKLARPERTYRELDEITDLIGVRGVTYFEDQVDGVGRRIEQAFTVDLDLSVDKRTPGQFGYRSLHYVCRVPEELQVEGCPKLFEIQVRTILQHAWAEIEHDLGYKSPVAIPEAIRRKLSRVAGLLEIADEEFVEIREYLERYRSDLAAQDSGGGERLRIDGLSLSYYVRRPVPADVDARIAARLGKDLSEELFFPDYLIRMLRHVGFRYLDELDQALSQSSDRILESVGPYFQFTREIWKFSERNIDACPRGYGLLFLAHLKVLESSPLEIARVEAATRFFLALDDPPDEPAARRAAQRLVEIFRPLGRRP